MMKLACAAGSLLLFLTLAPDVSAAVWPQWRGPDRTDVSRETGLLKSWPEGGPARIWLFEDAGMGYSGFSVVDGKLLTMGTRDGKEVLLSLDAQTGKELWATPLAEKLENKWGDGPRGTPTVEGDRVYALGGQGALICAKVADGSALWRATMQNLGGKTPGWGYTESVLVDGDRVICTPGGDQGAMAALDKRTGEVIWRSKEFTDPAQYASPIVFDFNGERQYAQLTMKTLAGISAKDGALLWRADWPGRTAVIPTPIFDDGSVYISSGYNVGCMLVDLKPGHAVEIVYTNKVMKNHHGGVIQVGDHLYGYSDGRGWVCQDRRTGDEVWLSTELGKGAVTCADGMLYCLEEKSGKVVLIEATPKGWVETGHFTLDPQTEIRSERGKIWTHPVIANGKLYLRDQDLIYCYQVRSPMRK